MTNAELLAKIKAEIERLKTVQLKRIQEGDLVDAEPYDKIEAYNELLDFIYTLESEKPLGEEYAIEIGKYTHTLRIGSQSDIDNLIRQEKQEQPEVELEERICSYDIVPYIDDKIAKLQDMLREEKVSFDWDDMKDMIEGTARHFAKWGAEHLADARKTSPKDLEEAADEYEKKHTYQRYDGGGLTPEYDATLAEAFIAGAKLQANHTHLPEDTVMFNKGVEEGKRLMMEETVSVIESRLSEIIGDAQPKPALRAELEELINKIKK